MKRLSREQCLEELRGCLLQLGGEEHSTCEVASRLGVMCHGFSQWSFPELKQRYWWLVERRQDITRPELERLANIWQLARQKVYGTQLACDTQSLERDTCCGFDGFSDADLARFHRELLGEDVEVVQDAED